MEREHAAEEVLLISGTLLDFGIRWQITCRLGQRVQDLT